MSDDQKYRELMEWFDELETGLKWRIAHYVIEGGHPLGDTLDALKAMETKERRHLRLVKTFSKRRH